MIGGVLAYSTHLFIDLENLSLHINLDILETTIEF